MSGDRTNELSTLEMRKSTNHADIHLPNTPGKIL